MNNSFFHYTIFFIIILASLGVSVYVGMQLYQLDSQTYRVEPISNCTPHPLGICDNNYHHILGCCIGFYEDSYISQNKTIGELSNATEIWTNSLGFRNKEYTIEKENDTTRIIFIGDSFVYGYGEPLNVTFPWLLEKKLNTNLPGRYEIWNIGVPSWSTTIESVVVKEKIISYDPDYVILLFDESDNYDNMLYRSREIRKSRDLIGFYPQPVNYYRASELQKLIEDVWEWDSNEVPLNPNLLELINTSADYLIKMDHPFEQAEIPWVVMPYPYPDTDEFFLNHYELLFTRLDQQGIEYYNLYDYLMGSTQYYSSIHRHWNSEGHEYVTEILYNYTIENIVK